MSSPYRTRLCLSVLPLVPALARAEPPGGTLLTRDRFNVEEKASFEWVWTVGEEGFGPGDQLVLRDPIFHGMRWSKWGDLSPWPELCTPQSTAQRASWGLVSAYAMRGDAVLDDVSLSVARSNCHLSGGEPSCTADLHRDTNTTIQLDSDGSLLPGDEVHLVVGDVDGCRERCEAAGEGDCSYCDDCGFEMPDRAFPKITWTAQACLGDADCVDLDPVSFQVSASPVVHAILATVPSQAVMGEPFRLKVALLDSRGNAVGSASRTLTVDLGEAAASVDEASHEMVPTDEGWHDFSVTVDEPGVYRFTVRDDSGMETTTNPVEVFSEPPAESIYWGDIHVHHGLSWTDEDGFLHDANHDYARDVAGEDVVSESMKAEGIEIDEDDLWALLQDNCSRYTVEGSYLVLLGFEWMGDIAAETFGTPTQGHHNVYYDACEAPLGTHDTDVIPGVDGDPGLWSWLDEVRETWGVEAVTIPHAMRWTGYDYTIANPGVQTLAEIYSEWGDDTTWSDSDDDTGDPAAGSTKDMLDHGLRLGWIGGSDNHDGWMGNPYSTKNVASGLAAFIAPALTRADIFETLRNRHTYATTGIRPILRFQAEDGGATLEQGQEYLARAPELRWTVHATAPIARFRLYRVVIGSGRQDELLAEEPGELDIEGSFTPDWSGEDVAWWIEFVQDDGEKAWSSPIWATSDCGRLAEYAVDPLGRCDGQSPGEDTAAGDTGSAEPPPARRCGCAAAPAGGAWLVLGLGGLLLRRRATGG